MPVRGPVLVDTMRMTEPINTAMPMSTLRTLRISGFQLTNPTSAVLITCMELEAPLVVDDLLDQVDGQLTGPGLALLALVDPEQRGLAGALAEAGHLPAALAVHAVPHAVLGSLGDEVDVVLRGVHALGHGRRGRST